MIPEPNNQLETRVRENRPGKDGGEGIHDFLWKCGETKEMKQLNRCAFELSFLVPNYLSTGLGQGVG